MFRAQIFGLAALLALAIFSGCKKTSDSRLAALCSGLSGKEFNDCILSADYASDKVVRDMKNMGGMGLVQFVGPVHKIKSASGCLSFNGSNFLWESCQAFDTKQQFHFVGQINTTYQILSGVSLEGIAFRIAPRAGVNEWSLDETGEKQMQCLTYAKDGLPMLAACDDAVYMMMIPNKYGAEWDKARWEKFQYGSIVALIKDTRQLNNAYVGQQNADKQASDTLDIASLLTESKGTTDETPEPVKRQVIDLGSIASESTCGSYSFLASQGKPKAPGSIKGERPLSRESSEALSRGAELAQFQCSNRNLSEQQEADASGHLWLYSCGLSKFNQDPSCQDLQAIKYYPDFQKERNQGGVVQILPKEKDNFCIKAEGERLRTIDDCERNAHDNATTQFRLETLENMPNGEVTIRLRSLLNGDECADLAQNQLQPCKQAKAYSFNSSANDLRVTAGDGKTHFYFFQSCMNASNHAQSSRYDCRREIPWKYQLYDKLSFWLGWIPIFGTIPSYVLGGLACASGEPEIAKVNCIGVGTGVALDVLTGDLMTLGSLIKFVGKQGMKIGSGSKMLVKALISRAAGAPAQLQMRKHTTIIRLIDGMQSSPEDFRKLMQTIRTGNDCAGAACAGPLIDLPTDTELRTMLQNVDKLNLTPQQKESFVRTIGPLFNR